MKTRHCDEDENGAIEIDWWNRHAVRDDLRTVEGWFTDSIGQPVEIDAMRCVWLVDSGRWADQELIELTCGEIVDYV